MARLCKGDGFFASRGADEGGGACVGQAHEFAQGVGGRAPGIGGRIVEVVGGVCGDADGGWFFCSVYQLADGGVEDVAEGFSGRGFGDFRFAAEPGGEGAGGGLFAVSAAGEDGGEDGVRREFGGVSGGDRVAPAGCLCFVGEVVGGEFPLACGGV